MRKKTVREMLESMRHTKNGMCWQGEAESVCLCYAESQTKELKESNDKLREAFVDLMNKASNGGYYVDREWWLKKAGLPKEN